MASTYLTRTPSSNSASRTAITFSVWLKRSNLGALQTIFHTSTSNSGYIYFAMNANDQVDFSLQNNDFSSSAPTGFKERKITNRRLRDVNAWYHIVCTIDTTLATTTDRLKIYINGERETSWSHETNNTQQSQALPSLIGSTSHAYNIGRQGNNSYFYDGSMTHFHYVDGTAYQASTFGETDSTTGIWKPKTSPTVTHGTNGFFLKFENSAAMGTDSAGSNNFAVNGTMTKLIDTPSNVFACLNAVLGTRTGSNGNVMALSNGSTTMESSDSAWRAAQTTLAVSSGKYYCELKFKVTGSGTVYAGIWSMDDFLASSSTIGDIANGVSYNLNTGQYSNAGSLASYGDAFSAGDILGIAIDLDNNKAYFARNGTWQNSGVPTSGSTGTGALNIVANKTYAFGASCNPTGSSSSHSWNFGNGYFGTTAVTSAQNPDDGIGIFEYDVPAGYRALCTKSINAQEYS